MNWTNLQDELLASHETIGSTRVNKNYGTYQTTTTSLSKKQENAKKSWKDGNKIGRKRKADLVSFEDYYTTTQDMQN